MKLIILTVLITASSYAKVITNHAPKSIVYKFRNIEKVGDDLFYVHEGDLKVTNESLKESSKLVNGKPAIEINDAIKFSKKAVLECQFLEDTKIEWILVEISLSKIFFNKKPHYYWLVTFRSPDDMHDEFKGKITKVAILLDGTTIKPIFKKIVVKDELLLLEDQL